MITGPTTLDKVRSIRLRLPVGVFLHRFLHKLWIDMVRNFKRTMVNQERCLPSGHTKQGSKGFDPGRRWRDELQLIANVGGEVSVNR